MQCPRDGTEMAKSRQNGFRYHLCPSCHGMLLQLRHMEEGVDGDKLTMPSGPRTPPASLEPELLSPVTGKPMTRHTEHGVTVDLCDDSGYVWLDYGEPAKLLRNLGQMSPSMAQKATGVAADMGKGFTETFTAHFVGDLLLQGGKAVVETLAEAVTALVSKH